MKETLMAFLLLHVSKDVNVCISIYITPILISEFYLLFKNIYIDLN